MPGWSRALEGKLAFLGDRKLFRRSIFCLAVWLGGQASPVWGTTDDLDEIIETQERLHTTLLQSLGAEVDPWTTPILEVRQAFSQAPPALQAEARRVFPNLVEPTLSLWPPHLLRDKDALQHAPSLTADHPAFERLNAVLQILEGLETHPSMTLELRPPLQTLRCTYQTYRDRLGANAPEKRRLLLSAVSLQTDLSVQAYLIQPHIASQLLSIDPWGIPVKRNATGSSIVTHVGSLYAKQNLLIERTGKPAHNTLNPPLEWAMSAFHRLLFGEGLVPSAVISLIDVPLPEKPRPLEKESKKRELIAQAMDMNVAATDRKAHQIRLNEDLTFKSTQSYLLQITPEIRGEFLGDFLKRAFTDPSLFETLDLAGVQGLLLFSMLTNPNDAKGDNLMVTSQGQVISIDNDLSLASFVVRLQPGYHALETRQILFAIPQVMDRPLLENVRTRFLAPEPCVFLLKWLGALHTHQAHYAPLLASTHTPDLLSLSFQQGILHTLLKKFTDLQKHLRANASLTPQQLLGRLSPLTALTYKTLRETHPLLQAFNQIYQQEPPLEEIVKVETNRNVQALLDSEHKEEDAYKNRTQTLGQAALELCNATDLSALPFLTRLLFFEDALNAFPESFQAITHPSWHDPSLLYEGARAPLKLSTFEVLVERFSKALNTADDKLGTPLHYAVTQAESGRALDFVRCLFLKGAETEVQNKKDLTPLDHVMESKNIPLFEAFVLQHKAGRRANPDIALQFYRWAKDHSFLPHIQRAFYLLEHRNQELAWHMTLAHLLPIRGEPPLSSFAPYVSQGFQQPCDLPEVKKIYKTGDPLLLKGATLGERVLPADLVPQLINDKGQVLRRNRDGNHMVGFVEFGDRRLYVKFYPELPGYEEAAGLLTRMIIGFGSPYNNLFRLGDVPVLISQGIGGENLNEVLTHHPQDLRLLDSRNLSALTLMAMLINPEDGKPDNYILQPLPDDPEKYQLVGIDNDHAFVPAIAKIERSFLSSEPIVQVKTILYSLDQMQHMLHPEVRTLFLSIHVGDLLEAWMRQLRICNHSYRQLFTTSEVTQLLGKHDTYLGIPFEKGAIERLYDKFVRLQRLLFEQPAITHLNLLCRLEPDLGNRYRKGFEKPLDPHERFKLLDEPFYTKTKDGHRITMTKSGNILKSKNIPLKQSLLQMMKGERAHEEVDFRPDMALKILKEIRTQHAEATLLEHILPPGASPQLNRAILQKIHLGSKLTEILKDIDFRNIGEPDQRAVFDLLKEKECDVLTLKNARVLTDTFLGNLNLKKIETLNLTGCLALTDAALPLFAQIPNLASLNVSDISSFEEMAQKIKGIFGRVTLEPLNFENLRSLNISRCPNLRAISLTATLLEQVNADACPALTRTTVTAPHFKLTLRDSPHLTDERLDRLIEGCPGIQALDLKGCDRITTLAWRERFPGVPVSMLSEKKRDNILGLLTDSSSSPKLDLSGCGQLTDKGLEALTAQLTGLTSLNLTFCLKITDRGLSVLAPLSFLISLNLQNCWHITDEGLSALTSFSSLCQLNLAYCDKITDGGLSALTPLSSLRELRLECCHKITDRGLSALTPLSFLTGLDLGYCDKITDKGKAKLRTILKNTRID